MKELVLDIGEKGQIESLHDDSMPLSSLNSGEVSMGRASHIKWDDMKQTWYVELMNGVIPHILVKPKGFELYEEARNFEVTLLNKCREYSIDFTKTSRAIKYQIYALSSAILD